MAAETTNEADLEATEGKPEPNISSRQEGQSVQDDVLQTMLNDEIRLRDFTEDVLDLRQEELEAQEAQNVQLSEEMDALKKQLSDTQNQLAEARTQLRSKSKQLQDAKDKIFQLQPQRKEIVESEVQESYRSLCGDVQRWVENRLKPMLDDLDSGRLRTRPAPTQATRFVSLLRDSGRRCLNIDQADEYHVIAVIMHYLWLAFFSRPFYCPMDDEGGDATIMWIDELASTMTRLPRDLKHCRDWRSETLTALTSQAAFRARRSQYLAFVTQDLASLLTTVITKGSTVELQGSLRRTIIEPAADLAHQLQLAPNFYSLRWPARQPWSRLEVYECINLASGGVLLDLSGTSPTSPARRKVSYLFDVCPGLFVERIEGGKKMALKAISRPRVLVYGGDVEVSLKPTILGWLWDNPTAPQSPIFHPPSRTATPKRSFTQQQQPGQPTGRKR